MTGARTIVFGLLVLGTVIAFEGMIQKASGTQKPYGFWEPEFAIASYGPFVNWITSPAG